MATKKSFADFLKNYSSNPELHRKAWRMGGVPWGDYKQYPQDYYAANTGSVPGCIYYADTVPFGKRNEAEILRAVREFEHETGAPMDVPRHSEDNETQYFNWLCWFAWERKAGELRDYLED